MGALNFDHQQDSWKQFSGGDRQADAAGVASYLSWFKGCGESVVKASLSHTYSFINVVEEDFYFYFIFKSAS